jgi:signal transduction histidine kinase
MIHDILDAGKLKAGERPVLKFSKCDLNNIISQTIEDFNFIYNNRFNYISQGRIIGDWSIKGIERLVENLAINAIKYSTPDTEINVILNQSSHEISLCFHNEGPAIPIKDQETLFENYIRLHSTEKKTGWGIGLSIVQDVARAHNGSVELLSSEGKGTTFIIKFPKPNP